jgi:hypothetical protein
MAQGAGSLAWRLRAHLCTTVSIIEMTRCSIVFSGVYYKKLSVW